MNCPIDNTELAMTERQGVEIDYCPTCRGVWLDRGELDKIIERDNTSNATPQPRYEERPKHDQYYDDRNHHYKKKKKESFLGDLFDF